MNTPSVLLIDRLCETRVHGSDFVTKMRVLTHRMDAIIEASVGREKAGEKLSRKEVERLTTEFRPVAAEQEALEKDPSSGLAEATRKRAIECGVIVSVDGALDWISSKTDPKDLGFSDIPNAAPPFPKFWVESSGKDGHRVGLWVESEVFDRNNLLSKKDHPNEHWRVKAMPFFEGKNITFATQPLIYTVDRLGNIVQPPELQTGGLPIEDWWMAHTLLIAISFMHCKNVKLQDGEVNVKLSKARVKKGKLPLVRYKTLIIDGMKKTLSDHGGSGDGFKKALHLCRGHFRTYTAKRPLFGHVVGTVWVPQHARGSSDQGVIVKDYKVKGQ